MEKIIQEIINEKLIVPGDQVLLALSGGADSVYLFYLLLALQKQVDFRFEAAHVNHGTRGKYSTRDQEFSRKLCEQHKITFHAGQVHMEEYAKEKKISKEDAGRRLRYAYFYSLMGDQWKLALGHHKDDQIETVLLNIFRGSGLEGLSGMERKKGRLIRPLLGLSKKEILTYLKDQQLDYQEDHTNTENDYRRNRIRNMILPYIEQVLDEEVANNIYRLAEIVQEENKTLTALTQETYEKLVAKDHFPIKAFKKEGLGLQRRLIRHFFEVHGSCKDLSFQDVERIRKLFDKEAGKKEFVGNFVFVRSNQGVYFMKNKEDQKANDLDEWALNQRFDFVSGSIYAQVIDREEYDKGLEGVFFDGEILKKNLRLRHRQPGDCIQLFGMQGRKKVKDLMIDEKVPSIYRENMVLLVDGDIVYHIFHLRRSALFPVTDQSEKILWIKESKKK